MASHPTPQPPLDTTRCPLCRQRNQCAIEAGAPTQDCWCMATPISPAALSALAPEQRGLACLCPACAAAAPAKPDAPI